MKDSRALITGLLVLLLLASHNLFLYCVSTSRIDLFQVKVWYNSELLLFISPLLFMGNSNNKSIKENEFRKIACFVFSFIVLIIIINNCSLFPLLPSPRLQMLFFNGISFAVIGYGVFFSDKTGSI